MFHDVEHAQNYYPLCYSSYKQTFPHRPPFFLSYEACHAAPKKQTKNKKPLKILCTEEYPMLNLWLYL